MRDVRVKSKDIAGPKLADASIHREPHFALHDQGFDSKRVGLRALNCARCLLAFEHFIKAAYQRLAFECTESHLRHDESLRI